MVFACDGKDFSHVDGLMFFLPVILDEDSRWPWLLHVRRESGKEIYVDSVPSPTKPRRRITQPVTQIDVSPDSTS